MGLGENSRSAIYLAFSAFVFVAALSMGYFLFKTVSDANVMTYKMTVDSDRNITTTLKIPTAYTVTGAEVRQSIYMIKDIGVDIVVDGVLYPKTLDPTTVNVSGINLAKNYTPTFVRDSNGMLTMLRFN
jgi:chloramphenicol 3-O-phosphotransferase